MIKFKEYITEVIHGKTDLYLPDGMLNYNHYSISPEILSKHYTPKITDKEHLTTIAKYTNDDAYADLHKIVNRALNKDIKGTISKYKPEISDLDSVTTSHEAPHDFHVYSGIKFDPSEGKDHKEPFKAHIKQFTSATIRPTISASFTGDGNHILKIHIPKGSKHGAYIHDHSTHTKDVEHMLKNNSAITNPLAYHGYEHEFLMKRGLNLKIHHVPEIKDRGYKIWHATVED